jgi:hypothetical protein
MSDQIPATQLPDPFDRRQGNNTSTQWVRDAFSNQTEKIDLLTEKVDKLHGTFVKSMPEGNVEAHHKAHVTLEQREIDRVKRDKERDAKAAESKKFWTGIKEDAMKNALRAAALFVIGLLIVGSQAKFKELVMVAVGGNTPAVEVKK